MRPAFTLGLALALTATGCGPTLKDSHEWNQRAVRAAFFHDVCKLQSYFETAHQPKPTTDTSVNSNGDAIFKLRSVETVALSRLVERFYKRAPALRGEVVAYVQYHLKGRHRTVPVGASTDLVVNGTSVSLPYHPCVGAFFFGEQRYRARRALLESGDASLA